MTRRAGGGATIGEWTFYSEDRISVFCSLFFLVPSRVAYMAESSYVLTLIKDISATVNRIKLYSTKKSSTTEDPINESRNQKRQEPSLMN
jgi:hypothetical protein